MPLMTRMFLQGLVANLLSFHTLVTMTKALQQLLEEGHTLDIEALSALSPYRTEHINRFGNYVINPSAVGFVMAGAQGKAYAPPTWLINKVL